MNCVKVSVIVPVYNTEKYLHRCLDSLVFQTLEEIEVIAVNDGSTDNCGNILDEYQAKYPDKVRVIHKENGGQASARNLALKLCKGEYIGFLDSDDFVKEDMFERMYTAVKKEDADYVACGYTDITYEDGKEIVLKEYVASKPAYATKDLFFGALVSPFLHLYKRTIMEESGVDFPEGFIYEDTAFYLNLIPYVKKIALIEESLAVRVRHSNSTTTTFKKERVRNIFPVFDNSLEFFRTKGFIKEYEKELEYFCVKVLLCSSMQRISKVATYKDALELSGETLQYIKENFADYKKNPYLGKKPIDLYMKSFNKITAAVYILIFRIMNKVKKEYQ